MLEAYFFDQGRVDAILLRAGGRALFIDAGFRADGVQCVKKLRKLGVTKLDAYLSSHLHKNHVGGAAPIIEAFEPDVIYAARDIAKATMRKYAQTDAEARAIERTALKVLVPGDAFMLGAAEISCLGPLKVKPCAAGAYAENGNSLILKVQYGARTMLLTGDSSSAILSAIDKKAPGAIRAEVLKNPHHNGAQSLAVLKKIAPEITVILNGAPAGAAYQKRLKQVGSAWYTACKKGGGDICLRTSGGPWAVQVDA